MAEEKQVVVEQPTNNGGGKGLAIGSLVCGIFSLIFGLIIGPFTLGIASFIGLVLGIVGIVLAVMARKHEKSGMSTGGLICSIIGLVFCALSGCVCGVCVCISASAGLL